ncbi:MAG: nitroreductase family protein [Thermoanaerobaculia bacterium]
MNLVADAIMSRRSVREGFSRTAIPRDVLEDIVRCGLAAPSSKNARPWRFHVVTNSSLLKELADMVERADCIDSYVPSDPATGAPRAGFSSSVMESAAALRNAPVAVFIENTGEFSSGRETLLAATSEALAGSIVGYTLEVIGVGAAVENMWLAAVGHGVAGVFMGDILVAERAIRQRLEINCDLIGVLVLGYIERSADHRVRHRIEVCKEKVRWFY